MKDKKQIEEMRIQRKLEMTKDISNGISGVLAYEIQKLAEHLISLNYVKLPKDSVVLSKECVSDKWIDLLTEFDEMGFEPTTLPPNDMSAEEYTAFYKDKLLMCLAKESKETAEKILNELFDIFDNKVGELLKIKKSNNTEYNDGRLCDCCECIDEIREIATREGVEIKE